MVTDTDRFEWRRALMGEHEVGIATFLFVLLGPPLAWTLHFVLIYFLVALYCTTGRTSVVWEVAAATAAFALLCAASGVLGWRRLRKLQGDRGWIEAVAGGGDYGPFILVMGVLGAVLFGLLIVVEGIPPLFVPTCSDIV